MNKEQMICNEKSPGLFSVYFYLPYDATPATVLLHIDTPINYEQSRYQMITIRRVGKKLRAIKIIRV